MLNVGYDSDALLALPEVEKCMSMPFQTEAGQVIPPSRNLIWPYACNRR